MGGEDGVMGDAGEWGCGELRGGRGGEGMGDYREVISNNSMPYYFLHFNS